jgi:type II secretory pathway component PulF
MQATLKDKAQFYNQLHQGLKAGVPMERMLAAEMLPKPFAPHARRILRNLEEGRPLSAGLRATGIIKPWEEQLLIIGEEGGRVPAVLRDLSDFFETRHRQLSTLKAKLVYPMLVVIVGILVEPLPALARGEISSTAYTFTALAKLLLMYVAFRLLIARPFERAVGAAFNPLLLKVLRHLKDQHWLRQHYEVAYLDLVTLCLDCGLNAGETLRLLRDASDDPDYRQTHNFAVQQIEIGGLSLSQVLTGLGIIRNTMLQQFLITAENSGTLHSDLRTILIRKRVENAGNLEHFVKKVAFWIYAGVMLTFLSRYL